MSTQEASGEQGRALVVGLGIAGIAAALRLHQVGWEVVVAEKAPARRSDGYFILLFGTGIASAGRLGVLDAIGDRGGPTIKQWEVNRAGRRSPGANPREIPVKTAPRLLLRGDVERGLFTSLPDDVEIRWSTSPVAIAQDEKAVHVTLHDDASGDTVTERYDLVVGADGMRSTVRSLAFGPESYLEPMNYVIAVTVLDSPVDGFPGEEGLTLAEPGRSAWTFPFVDCPPSLLFSYRSADVDAEFTRPPAESIRRAFGPRPLGPLLTELIDRFEAAPHSLFDSVHQVKMPRWSNGRVVLVGDSAWCLTLYSGMGASSAMAGAELLGTMLERHPTDVPAALAAWETRMRPFAEGQQEAAQVMRTLFTPHDRKAQLIRRSLVRAMNSPGFMRVMSKAPMLSGMADKGMAEKDMDVAAA